LNVSIYEMEWMSSEMPLILGEFIVMSGAFAVLFAFLICCIHASESSTTTYRRKCDCCRRRRCICSCVRNRNGL